MIILYRTHIDFVLDFQVPTSSEEWKAIAKDFSLKWNFPHCLGALDGKHVVMQAPAHAGSHFFNYKKTHSIVLLALVDANYRFIFVDSGCNGRISDGGVSSRCTLSSSLERNELSLPDDEGLSDGSPPLPFVVVADDAFPLKRNIMKPYPFRNQPAQNRVFNYRLSRARRCVENAFGILCQIFRIFRRPILVDAEKSQKIVLAACSLHNYILMKSSSTSYSGLADREDDDGTLIPGIWRNEALPTRSFLSIPSKEATITQRVPLMFERNLTSFSCRPRESFAGNMQIYNIFTVFLFLSLDQVHDVNLEIK